MTRNHDPSEEPRGTFAGPEGIRHQTGSPPGRTAVSVHCVVEHEHETGVGPHKRMHARRAVGFESMIARTGCAIGAVRWARTGQETRPTAGLRVPRASWTSQETRPMAGPWSPRSGSRSYCRTARSAETGELHSPAVEAERGRENVVSVVRGI